MHGIRAGYYVVEYLTRISGMEGCVLGFARWWHFWIAVECGYLHTMAYTTELLYGMMYKFIKVRFSA